MVAARYADESDDAIPADRMVLDPVPLMTVDDITITAGNYSIPLGQLYLRPEHRYRITISDERGKRIAVRTVTVGKDGGSLTSAGPTASGHDACIATTATAPEAPQACQRP